MQWQMAEKEEVMKKLAILSMLIAFNPAMAGEADVVAVDYSKSSDGSYTFKVAVLHADTGWDHYANRWEVVDENGTVLATRTLLHPHENEQPFTRSLSGVNIPAGTTNVIVRAHDSVHELGGKEMVVEIK